MQQEQDGLKTAPEKLVRGFTASRFMFWMALALVAHVVIIGVTSVGYIRDRIDPEGAALRKAAAEAAAKAMAEKAAPKTAPAPAAGTVTGAVPARAAAPTNAATDEALLQQRKDTPVVKAITQLPATNEIPRQPDELGISINDTNVK